jgi:hypothetical protein
MKMDYDDIDVEQVVDEVIKAEEQGRLRPATKRESMTVRLGACCTCGFFACSCKKSSIIGLLTQFVRYKYSFYEYLYYFMHEVQQTACRPQFHYP